MGIVDDLLDEYNSLQAGLVSWHKYWRSVAAYVLPQTEGFDTLINRSPQQAIAAVGHLPVAHDRSKNIYDMTSIWAVERLAAGILSLKTPETMTWHELTEDSDFEADLSQEEEAALEKIRDYLFKVRSNPMSGFWPAHRAAIRSMCAFGDGWMFIPETQGVRTVYRYEYVPLSECVPGVDPMGNPNRMFRVFKWTAAQIAAKWGEKAGTRVMKFANDPKRRHDVFEVMQAIRPRDEEKRWGKMGVMSGPFESHYILPQERVHIGEGGYYEFPFVRYAWSNVGAKAQCEGPVAYALGEIKSLQEMSKNELIASQQAIRPAYGVHNKNMGRINMNPGAVTPGLVNGEGKQLFAPLTGGARPDFAQAVLESRRNAVRETMYLNLWQVLIEQPEKTATEAMIRAQEKGELLGPVGISLNSGLAHMVDREIAVLDRAGAFEGDSPLALPDSMAGRNVGPVWTSPLDKLRRMGELMGMQRLAQFAGELGTILQDPSIGRELNPRNMLDTAREVLGAPVDSLRDKDAAAQEKQNMDQMQGLMGMLQAAKGGGDAMQSVAAGAAGMAQAAEVTGQAQNAANQLPAGVQQALSGAA